MWYKKHLSFYVIVPTGLEKEYDMLKIYFNIMHLGSLYYYSDYTKGL